VGYQFEPPEGRVFIRMRVQCEDMLNVIPLQNIEEIGTGVLSGESPQLLPSRAMAVSGEDYRSEVTGISKVV